MNSKVSLLPSLNLNTKILPLKGRQTRNLFLYKALTSLLRRRLHSMTDKEHKALRRWVADGNSPYSNPALYADDRGIEMDFISGWRSIDDLAV